MQLRVFLSLRSQRSHATVQLLVTAHFYEAFPLTFVFVFSLPQPSVVVFWCWFARLYESENFLHFVSWNREEKAQISPLKAATLERLGSLRQEAALPHSSPILPYFWWCENKNIHISYTARPEKKSNVRFLEIPLIYWNPSKSEKLE